MMKRVGIPRALLYYRFGEFWRAFFHNLGFKVVLSPRTDKTILESGLSRVSSEVCLPIKLLAGHIAVLKDEVDYLFVPRLVSSRKNLYACPKMIGMADVVRLQLGRSIKLLSPNIKRGFFLPHFLIGWRLSKNPLKTCTAYRSARSTLVKEKPIPEFPPDRLKIGFLSHFYILGDGFITQDILDVFKNANAILYTKEDLPEETLGNSQGFAGSIQWIYERELYNAFEYYLDRVDGICNIIAFGCGPDSLVSELMLREAKVKGVPFLQLIIDEHTAKAGLLTRIEAFLELVERSRRAKKADISEINHQIEIEHHEPSA